MNSEFCIAVHGLAFLSLKQKSLSSEVLAANICTNPVRVRKVMAKLKKAGLVRTKEGSDGGYFLNLAPEKISLKQVSLALDTKFVSSSWRSGSQDLPCMVSSGMAEVMDSLYSSLDGLCQKHLASVTVQDICQMLLEKNGGRQPSCAENGSRRK